MAQKRGYFVIKNSAGTVTMQGLATLTNDVMSVNHNDATAVMEHRDADNIPRTFTRDFLDFRMTLRLTPGIGSNLANQAAVAAAIASLRKMDTIVTASFEDSDFNWASGDKGFIEEVGKVLQQGDLMSVDVTARKLATTAGVALDFSAAWTDL